MKAFIHDGVLNGVGDMHKYRQSAVQRSSLCVNCFKVMILSMVFVAEAQTQDPISDALRAAEMLQMKWLAEEQSRPGAQLSPFTTDGCSGGMSEAWYLLAHQIPSIKTTLGEKPPWEQCCVDHDRVYWIGVTKNGYGIREQADHVLKNCVIKTGAEKSKQISKASGFKQEEIERLFKIAAEMMYQAVRIGGKPCSLLPWRWGYGWPQCQIHLETANNEKSPVN